MSFFSFLKRNKKNYSLIINIGSGSVTGGIAKFTEQAGVDMLNYEKEIFPFQEEISVTKHLDLMKSSLDSLITKIRSTGLNKIPTKKGISPKIDRVFCLFSSPWSISQTKTVKIEETKAFKVTEKYIHKVVAEQEKQFQTDIGKSGKIIERKIIKIRINGYEVENFNNKITNELEISIFFTVVPENIISTVDDIISKTFSLKNMWGHSSALAIFSAIRNIFPQEEDFIYVDISEEITDISIIRDGVEMLNASTPFGRNDYLRELSKELKITEEIADSTIKMYSAKENNELASLKSAVVIENTTNKWFASISDVLSSFKEKRILPEKLFLVIDSDLAHILKTKLAKQDFNVILIDSHKLKTKMTAEDVIFKLELMFLDRLYKI
jgi:cell division ATPase FtsA